MPEVSHQSKHREPQMVTQELLSWRPQAPTVGLELCFRPVLSEPPNPISQQPCTKLIKKIIKLIKKKFGNRFDEIDWCHNGLLIHTQGLLQWLGAVSIISQHYRDFLNPMISLFRGPPPPVPVFLTPY